LTREERAALVAGWRTMGYKLYGPRVAVVRDKAEERTDGGIYIPETHQTKTPVGTIIAVGPGVDLEEFNYGFVPGDRVMFSKYGGTTFRVLLADGSKVDVEYLNAKDIFVGWDGEDPNELPEENK